MKHANNTGHLTSNIECQLYYVLRKRVFLRHNIKQQKSIFQRKFNNMMGVE